MLRELILDRLQEEDDYRAVVAFRKKMDDLQRCDVRERLGLANSRLRRVPRVNQFNARALIVPHIACRQHEAVPHGDCRDCAIAKVDRIAC